MRPETKQTVILIAGSREFKSWKSKGLLHWKNLRTVFKELNWFMKEYFPGEQPHEVFKNHFSGAARGADELGEWWAYLNGIPTNLFHADWEGEGKAGGPIRNSRMVQAAINATELSDSPPCLVAFWDGESKGTADMIRKAEKNDFWTHIANF